MSFYSSKKYKEWSDGLRTELAALKLQYEEMDAEDHELSELRSNSSKCV